MKNTYFLVFVVIFISLTVSSCSNSLESDEPDIFYFNSFENTSDLSKWLGFGTQEIRNDSPSGCGQYSVYISGGCDIPHAYIEFPELSQSCSLIVKCFGKNLLRGGSVTLRNRSKENSQIRISISDSSWRGYESWDTLICEKNDKLSLELSSGGFVHSAMLVDAVEIKIIK